MALLLQNPEMTQSAASWGDESKFNGKAAN